MVSGRGVRVVDRGVFRREKSMALPESLGATTGGGLGFLTGASLCVNRERLIVSSDHNERQGEF